MTYPQEILDKLELARTRTNLPVETINKFYEDILGALIPTDFPDDIERFRYAIQLLWVNHVSRPPVYPKSIIPVGYSKIRTLKNKSVRATLYVIDAKDFQIHPITLFDEQVDLLKSITLKSCYNDVNLGVYNDNITYTSDNRAKFGQPEMVESTYEEILSNFNFPLVVIKDIEKNLSKRITTSTSSYTDERDWKIIEGTIQHVIQNKATGVKLGYNVVDYSVATDEPKILPNGQKRNPGITIWMHESLMTPEKGDYCRFYGPADKATPKEEDAKDPSKAPPEPSMNAFVVIKKRSGVGA